MEMLSESELPMKTIFLQVGAKIAYYRTLRGLKQEELAKMAHVSQSVLSRIESGKYNETLSVPTLFDIADGLQIDMSLLVSFNEVEKQMWWRTLPSELDEATESENNNLKENN